MDLKKNKTLKKNLQGLIRTPVSAPAPAPTPTQTAPATPAAIDNSKEAVLITKGGPAKPHSKPAETRTTVKSNINSSPNKDNAIKIIASNNKAAELAKNIKFSKVEEFDIDQLKALKLAELKTAYKKEIEKPFTTDEGYSVNFNDIDILRLGNYIEYIIADTALNGEDPNAEPMGYLTLSDNTTVEDLPLSVLASVKFQMLTKNSFYHGFKQWYRGEIYDAETKEDLDKIKFTFDLMDMLMKQPK